jgi:hypothetical protein
LLLLRSGFAYYYHLALVNMERQMDTTKMTSPSITSELLVDLHEAVTRAANGVRDPEVMRQACERMDRISEQVRQRHGVLDIGTPAIRELREAE